jgi:large repetitive protein
VPSVTITKQPKDKFKTKRKTKNVTFEFSGTDVRAIASFQCSLDGGPFSTCTSPYTVKVKKGKHTFQVRALDQAGNVGPPASDDWKIKKKKKR